MSKMSSCNNGDQNRYHKRKARRGVCSRSIAMSAMRCVGDGRDTERSQGITKNSEHCARSFSLRLRDGFNGDLGPRLTMTDVTAVTRLWLVLDDRDLVGTTMLANDSLHDCASNDWRTNLHSCTVVGRHEQCFKSHWSANLEFDLFYAEHLALADDVLFTTCRYYCKHRELCC